MIWLLQKMLTILKPDFLLTKVIFQPQKDPQNKLEISKTLLRIYRTPGNIFQEMTCSLLKMLEEFEEEDFFKEKHALFTNYLTPKNYQNIFVTFFFTKQHDTPNQTPIVQFSGV